MKKIVVWAVTVGMLCICFAGCRTQKNNDPTSGRTEPSSVPSSDPTDMVTDPSIGLALPEDPVATNPAEDPTKSTEPSGNGADIGTSGGQSNSDENRNESPSVGGSSSDQTPADPTTPPTTPPATDSNPETSEPVEIETEPAQDEEEENRIELPVVTWPSGN